MSDLPPFLSHTTDRNIPWKGHDSFPRRVFQERDRLNKKFAARGWTRTAYSDLRIFKKAWGPFGEENYIQLHRFEIEQYMENPDHV